MSRYQYRLLNVFTVDGQRLSGNPLCVIEDARGLDTASMQAIALQFNLSETTFILPSTVAHARVRIFTPTFEMPFAGHPTLGTAQVVRELLQTDAALTLEMQAGVITVTVNENRWTLRANSPQSRPVTATHLQLAEMLGLTLADIGDSPLWINTGSEQLIVPLTNLAAVQRCNPQPQLLARHAALNERRHLVYVWAERAPHEIAARFFFSKGAGLAEDPATGSACANLGGWFMTTGATKPINKRIYQGAAVGRASQLDLQVDAGGGIYVSGEVIELGRGMIAL